MNKQTHPKAHRRAVFMIAFSALAAGIGTTIAMGISTSLSVSANCRIISDAFFVIGVLYTGVGALVAISTTGFFDMLAYAVKSLPMLFSVLRKPKDIPTFYDYKTAKAEKRQKAKLTILIVGICCIAVSLLALFGYYSL